jgi:Protein of unknown function (DUF3618)
MTSPYSTSAHTGTSSSDPEEIRREIERTQAALSTDVDALAEKVTPSRIAQRRVDRVRDTASRWKDKVMGSDPHPGYTTGTYGGGPSVSDRAHHLAGSASDTIGGTAQSARVDRLRHRLPGRFDRARCGPAGSAGGRASDPRKPARGRAHRVRRGLARVLTASCQPTRAGARRAGQAARK